jgi:hypothetical protein
MRAPGDPLKPRAVDSRKSRLNRIPNVKSRARDGAPPHAPTHGRGAPEIVFSHLMEGIGLTLDPSGGRMFITDFGGSDYRGTIMPRRSR